MEDSKLKLALILNLDQEIGIYEENMKAVAVHEFSVRYKRKKKSIIRWSERDSGKNKPIPEYRQFRRHRIALLIAVIVLMLSTANTVLAVVKPEILYIIKEKITNWTITFENSDSQKPAFVHIKPPVPEGYQLVDETKGPDYYDLTFRNESGQERKAHPEYGDIIVFKSELNADEGEKIYRRY